jgi:hypothetical protein
MPLKSPIKSLQERVVDAEVRGSHWLAEGNAASEAGNAAKAERCYAKSQFWLDRFNLLTGRSEKPAPLR